MKEPTPRRRGASGRRVLAAALLLCAAAASAAVPQRLNYQGKLANAAGDPLSGTYSFRFKLFAAETGGAALFSEDVTGALNAVSVVNGIYSVQIGSYTAGGIPYGVFDGQDLYLEIDVAAGTSLASAETLTPRERLNAAAWAVHALGAERLGTGAVIATFTAVGALELPSGSTVTSNGTLTLSTAASAALSGTPALFIDRDGKVGIGTSDPRGPLHLKDSTPSGANAGGLIIEHASSLSNSPRIALVDTALGAVTSAPAWFIDNATDVFRIFRQPNITTNGAEYFRLNASSAVFLSAKVGIGMSNPGAKLDVEGGAQFGTGAAKSTFTATPGGATYALRTSSGVDVGGTGGVVAAFFEGVHVGDGSRLSGVSGTDSSKVAKAGDTMSGGLTITQSGETLTLNTDPATPAVELRDTDGAGLAPYLDFSTNAADDYNGRIQYGASGLGFAAPGFAFTAYNGAGNASFPGVVSATTFSGALSGNAATASALAADPANCAAGSFPLGVSAAGAAESCTAVSSLAPTLTGGGASGTWGISVTGNAATVTNGVYTTGSYADPSWLTSVGGGKVSGAIPPVATGAASVKTVRDVWGNGLYGYRSYSDPNAPTTYGAAVGFGNGAGGSGEFYQEWTSPGRAYHRYLRDTIDPWSSWMRLLDTSNDPYPSNMNQYVRTTDNVVFNSISGGGSGLTSLNPANLSAGTAGISVTGNAATATTLAANGSNCAAGSYPLGVDASGNAESCSTSVSGDAGSVDGIDGASLQRLDSSQNVNSGIVHTYYNTAGERLNTLSGNRSLTLFQATASSDAFMTFHVSGDYAAYFGLGGAENDFVVGGWSMGNVRYKVWHAGNDGSGSTLDADVVDGLNPTSAATGSTLMSRDANGDSNVRYLVSSYLNMSHAASGATTDTIFYSSTDDYIRKNNATGFRASLNVPTRTGGDASGTWGISVTGNAGTATNVAWTGITSKPAWMTATNLITDLANANNSVPSGFYQYNTGTNYPSAGTWYNLLNVRHSNTANDHGFQIAASYYSSDFFTRTYQGGTGANDGTYTPWSRLNYSRSWVGGAGTTGTAGTYGNTWRLGSSAADGTSSANSWLYLYNGAGSAYHDLAAGNVWANGSFQNGTITAAQVVAGLYAQGNREMATNDNASTSYSVAALELRESQYGATSGFLPPRLSFHWGGVVASQLALESTGRIAVRDNPGTGYENLIARDITGSGTVFFGTGGSYKVTSAGAATLATSAFGGVNPTADNVGNIGTTALRWTTAHAVNFYGAYNAGPDLAERYPASEPLEPGDVVVFDAAAPADKTVFDQSATKDRGTVAAGKRVPVAVRRSTVPYQSGLIGVVSTAPGVKLQDPGDEKNPAIGLVGRVPVKVCDENGPVRPGDRLTSSSRPGYAMRATGAGPAVAIALQGLDGKEGRVLAFIQTGEANVRERLAEQDARLAAQERAIAELREELKALKTR